MPQWDSALYLKFKAQRTQPAKDLAARMDMEAPSEIIDIGCGPGNSTRVLKDRFPNARILGIDSSPDMIEAARSDNPDMEFMLLDAANELDSLDKRFDAVFSNACLQWIPGHHTLMPRLMGLLKDGGMLAVQLPMIYDEPIHRIIESTADSEKWRGRLRSGEIFHRLSQGEYFDILSGISSDLEMWQTVYLHRMPSHDSILEWYRGTGLRPYLEQLDEPSRAEFESDILTGIKREYPPQANGEIIFRFPRFFIIAVK